MDKDLELIKRYQKEMGLIGHAMALLSWDQETKMPEKGIETRVESRSYLSSILHDKVTSEEFFKAIKRLKKKKLSKDNQLIVKKFT